MSGQPTVPLPDGPPRPSGSASAPVRPASDDVSGQPAPVRCGHCAAPASARVTYRVTSGTRTTFVCIGHIAGVTLATKVERKCSRCGHYDETTTTHSSVEECSGCWHHRKLDAPAARHWAKVAQEFLSNVDAYDMLTYLPKALEDVVDGNGEPLNLTWGQLLRGAQAIMLHSERVLKDGPYHLWTEEREKK